jgi:HlyD family secretion protein
MFSKIGKKGLWIILGVLILASAGGFAYYRQVVLPSQTVDEPQIQTAVARQGDLVIYASGSGTLTVMNEVALGFGTSGTVAELHVQVGDTVKTGDVLAVQAEREELEAAVATDELAVREAQKALDDLYENADTVAAQAQLDLADARDALNTAQYTWNSQQEGNRASKSTIDAAKAELVLAEDRVDKALKEYNLYYGRPKDDPARALALTKLVAAQQSYNSALSRLNWYLGKPTDIQQAELDAELAMAEAKAAEAERAYDRVKDGPDPDEVAKAQLQLEDAKAKLTLSQRNLGESTISAPMDGTILEVTAQVGQEVAGSFITLANLGEQNLEIYLDETDMNNIQVGYEADVTFDALPDQVFKGHVTLVDPSLQRSGMVSAVRGMVKLDEGAVPADTRLLVGMSASVDVIAGRAMGAVLVPVEALRELSPGEYAVFVVENGELKLRPVEVGLMDVTYAEIKSGLTVGEVVSTGIVETQ